MSDENKRIALRVPLEAMNEGRLEAIDETVAADVIEHGERPPGMPAGTEGLKIFVQALRSAFPDFKVTIEEQVAEGDLVSMRGTSTGTMQGDFAGMPASGKRATWSAMHMVRIANGKVVEHWAVEDRLSMLQQLGLAPSPEGAPAG